jgi:2Fe-2S ferredoxin
MPKITFLPVNGAPIEIDASPQMTLMELAVINDVPGILGMCGGICSCATCHVFVGPEWQARLPAASGEEQAKIEGLAHRNAESRLGCQVTVTDAMDGLVVRVAEPE